MIIPVLSLLLMALIGRAAGKVTPVAEGDYACLFTTTGGMECWGLDKVGDEDMAICGAGEPTPREAMGYVDLGTGGAVISIAMVDTPPCGVLEGGSNKVCKRLPSLVSWAPKRMRRVVGGHSPWCLEGLYAATCKLRPSRLAGIRRLLAQKCL